MQINMMRKSGNLTLSKFNVLFLTALTANFFTRLNHLGIGCVLITQLDKQQGKLPYPGNLKV